MEYSMSMNMQGGAGRKTVFLFIGSRSYMSDLLQTRYVEYLSSTYRVVVFLKDLDGIDDPDTEYYKNENITYIILPLPDRRWRMLFEVYLRNELIQNFNWDNAVAWRNRRATDKKRLFLRRIGRLLPNTLFSPKRMLWLEALYIPEYRQFKHYVKKYQPSLILTPTPGIQPYHTHAVLCARKARIPSVAINFSWDNLTSIPRHIRATDYLICWNEWIKGRAIDLHGYDDAHVFVAGTPRFDHYFLPSPHELDRKTFLSRKGLDPNRKTILAASRRYSSFSFDFIRAFLNWQEENHFGEKLNLLVRVHPLDPIDLYKEFFNMPNVRIEYGSQELKQSQTKGGHKVEMDAEDMANMKDTLKYADVCVNIASTVSIEACIFDMPVINSGFADEFSEILNFPHYKPVVESGAVRVAKNMDEVAQYIMMYLKDRSIDRENRKKIVDLLIKPTDGYSYKRNVDFLNEIIGRESSIT